MQGSIVQLFLQTCEHCLILADVIDHGHHDGEGVLPRLQCHIGSSELKEDENLFLVPNDASLSNWEDIGGNRGHGEAEGDRPLQLALSHQLRLHFKSHQLDNVLQGLLEISFSGKTHNRYGYWSFSKTPSIHVVTVQTWGQCSSLQKPERKVGR